MTYVRLESRTFEARDWSFLEVVGVFSGVLLDVI